MKKITIGYIYCFSNPSIPSNTFKIGYSKRTPDNRLNEANRSSWVVMPFKIEFAKKVSNPIEKEHKIHTLLMRFTKRPNPNREFFEANIEDIKSIFDLIDGEWWGDITMNTHNNESDTNNKKYKCSKTTKSKKNIVHRYPTRLSFKNT